MTEQYKDPDWLYEQYVENDRTLQDMADECGVTYQTISRWCGKFDVKTDARASDDEIVICSPTQGRRNEKSLTRQTSHRPQSLG